MNAAPAQGRLLDAIRGDLLSSHFAPGDRLVEIDLAARYGAPRAAVRTALITLAAEGLVERQPHRGASVRALTIDEGVEIAESSRRSARTTRRRSPRPRNGPNCWDWWRRCGSPPRRTRPPTTAN